MTDGLVTVFVEIIDSITILVIFLSFCYAILHYVMHYTFKCFWRPKGKNTKWMNAIRMKLWENLLFALELLICADIILSVQDPSVEHLTQLWIIVLIRILIAYFLQREIHEIEDHQKFKNSTSKKKGKLIA